MQLMASACPYQHVELNLVVMLSSSPRALCAGGKSRRAGVDQQAAERKMCMIRFTSTQGLSLYSEAPISVLLHVLNVKSLPAGTVELQISGIMGMGLLGDLSRLQATNAGVLLCGDGAQTYLWFPGQVLLCRSVWCGRLRSRAQDRGWALLHMFYSNTRSASLLFHLSHSSPSLRPSLPWALVHLPPPPLTFSQAPPSLLSFSPLPPPSSSCDGSTPCSQNHSPASQENGVQRGVPAHR